MANKKRSRRNKKSSRKSYTLVAIIGIVCVGAIVVASVLHNNKVKQTDGTDLVTPSVTTEPTIGVTVTPTPEVTVKPAVSPTPEVTGEATVTEAPKVTEAEALKLVTDAIADNQYTVVLKKEPLSIEGKEYYAYVISKDGVEINPEIIVLKENGTLYYYDNAGVISAFTKFPLDKVETATPEGEEISKDAAIERVAKLSKKVLGLSKDLKDYIVEVDEWPTTVNGENTYCLNVFDKMDNGQQLVGIYYVSLDGKDVYNLNDETQEFILISEE